jgi:hypothetical protein
VKKDKDHHSLIKHQESEVNISNFFGFQNKQQISAVKVAPQPALISTSNESSMCANIGGADLLIPVS